MFCALLSVVRYMYFSNNYKFVCIFLLSFILVWYISVYLTSVNSMYLNFFALAERVQVGRNKLFLSKIVEKTVVCDANRCSFSFHSHFVATFMNIRCRHLFTAAVVIFSHYILFQPSKNPLLFPM